MRPITAWMASQPYALGPWLCGPAWLASSAVPVLAWLAAWLAWTSVWIWPDSYGHQSHQGVCLAPVVSQISLVHTRRKCVFRPCAAATDLGLPPTPLDGHRGVDRMVSLSLGLVVEVLTVGIGCVQIGHATLLNLVGVPPRRLLTTEVVETDLLLGHGPVVAGAAG